MTRILVLLVVGATLVRPISAQRTQVILDAGPTFPVGSYRDFAKTGWLVGAGIRTEVGNRGAFLTGELIYGRNNHSDIAGDKTSVTGLLATAGYRLGRIGRARTYLLGGLGFLNRSFGTAAGYSYAGSDWGVAVAAGGGAELSAGRLILRAELKWLGRSESSIVPFQIGVGIPIGAR